MLAEILRYPRYHHPFCYPLRIPPSWGCELGPAHFCWLSLIVSTCRNRKDAALDPSCSPTCTDSVSLSFHAQQKKQKKTIIITINWIKFDCIFLLLLIQTYFSSATQWRRRNKVVDRGTIRWLIHRFDWLQVDLCVCVCVYVGVCVC